MKLRNIFFAAAVLLGAFACTKETEGVSADGSYPIELKYVDTLCTVDIPQSAKAGETVNVKVSVIKDEFHISAVTLGGVKTERISSNEDITEGVYVFTMPAKKAEVAVIVVENEPDHYPITYTSDPSFYTVDVVEYGPVGEKITVTVAMTDITRKITSAKYNGEECDLESVSEANSTYVYTFTMPDAPVQLTFTYDKDMHYIHPVSDAHSFIIMYNCSDEWDLPDDERHYDEIQGRLVKFWWGGDLGYKATLKATDAAGGNIEYFYTDQDQDFGECWYCVMPDMELTLEVTSVEKNDYVGKPFTGDYSGYRIKAGSNRLYTPAQPEVTLSMKENTAFFFKTADDMEYDFDGCYLFNEDTDRFSYLEEYALDAYRKKDFGLSGKWFDNGDVFLYTTDLQVPKPDRARYYFASLNPNYTYADAADGDWGFGGYGERHLAEITRGGEKTWYLFQPSDLDARQVKLVFERGTSITEECSALVYDGDTPIYRYTCYSSGYPAFTKQSSEAGTYTSAGSPDLVLDGFGNAVLGSQKGTYTAGKGVVTVNFDGTTYLYSIYAETKTYARVVAEEWNGPKAFSVSTTGVFRNSESAAVLSLTLDSGEKGRARIVLNLADTAWGGNKDVVSDTVVYAWNPFTGQLQLFGILVGTADGRGTERVNLSLNVAADLKSITREDDFYLRATSGGNDTYLNLKGLVLTAAE